MSIAEQIGDAIQEVSRDSSEVKVVFASLIGAARVSKESPVSLSLSLIRALTTCEPSTTWAMPTFTRGFSGNGVCDLDSLPSHTGTLSEQLRLHPESIRTRSAFFSFAVLGPLAKHFWKLSPECPWGESSPYSEFLRLDSDIITVGLHTTHCSFTHHAEYLERERIPYRFEKTFRGKILRDGQLRSHRETLFSRYRTPYPQIDFTFLEPYYFDNGMRLVSFDGITVSSISAQSKMDVVRGLLSLDPLALIVNKEDYR